MAVIFRGTQRVENLFPAAHRVSADGDDDYETSLRGGRSFLFRMARVSDRESRCVCDNGRCPWNV